MKLYHGSNIEINEIDLSRCRPYKDFGQGFYLTSLPGQAVKMANRVSRIYGGRPCTTVFDFDNSLLKQSNLSTRIFQNPSKEWALFVINNRNRDFKDHTDTECNHDLKYDFVTGPIANDDLALLFRQFSNKLISVDTLVKEMEFKKLTNQYSFHTTKALAYLKKAGVIYE
ncbi:MAG: DUF3990 domain-containing protein [Eubacteriales bacterium]|nr:DUF3990 domain-containing protein [Eubacteriales bacterium]